MLREYALPFLLRVYALSPSYTNKLRLYNRSNKIHNIMMAGADADADAAVKGSLQKLEPVNTG